MAQSKEWIFPLIAWWIFPVRFLYVYPAWWTNILPWKITILHGKIHYKSPFLMGKSTISIAIFQFAFCKRSPGRVYHPIPASPKEGKSSPGLATQIFHGKLSGEWKLAECLVGKNPPKWQFFHIFNGNMNENDDKWQFWIFTIVEKEELSEDFLALLDDVIPKKNS